MARTLDDLLGPLVAQMVRTRMPPTMGLPLTPLPVAALLARPQAQAPMKNNTSGNAGRTTRMPGVGG